MTNFKEFLRERLAQINKHILNIKKLENYFDTKIVS